MINSIDEIEDSNSIALVEGEEFTTYHQLHKIGDHIVSDVAPRSLVLFKADNTVESVSAYVALVRTHSVPLMVEKSISQQAMQQLIEAYKPSYIWCGANDSVKGKIEVALESHVLVKTEFQSPKMHESLALLLTTSGSTGSRKYVRLSYENVSSNTKSIIKYLDIRQADRAITTLPFSYSYGLSIINSHLAAGASIILTERTLLDREFWEQVKTHEATTFGGVPYTYQMLKRLRFERMELPSLRYLTQAGGHLDIPLQKEFVEVCTKKEISFFIMYGQTEGTARLSYLPPEKIKNKLGSIGVAIPGGRFALFDENEKEIREPHTAGELVYYGKNVSLGYASSASDLAFGDTRKGQLKTGDIACMDEDGFYTIVGRKKRFLKIFGNRVNLDEIEAKLIENGFCAACSGKDDNMVIYVESGDVEEIKQTVSKFTRLHSSAFCIKTIDKIPRNETGKILYSVLEKE